MGEGIDGKSLCLLLNFFVNLISGSKKIVY